MTKPPWVHGPQGEISHRLQACTCPHGCESYRPHLACPYENPQHYPQADGGTSVVRGAEPGTPSMDAIPPSGGGAQVPGGSTSPAATEAHAPSSHLESDPTFIEHGKHSVPPDDCPWCPSICHCEPEATPAQPLALHRERVVEALHRYEHYECTTDPCPKLTLAQERTDAVLATAVDLDPVVADLTRARTDYIDQWLSEEPEVSEAWEAWRKWGLDDATGGLGGPHALDCDTTNLSLYKAGSAPDCTCGFVPKPEGVGSEFADIFIRLLDNCAAYGIDLRAEYERKIAYNRTRPMKHGGKRA